MRAGFKATGRLIYLLATHFDSGDQGERDSWQKESMQRIDFLTKLQLSIDQSTKLNDTQTSPWQTTSEQHKVSLERLKWDQSTRLDW